MEVLYKASVYALSLLAVAAVSSSARPWDIVALHGEYMVTTAAVTLVGEPGGVGAVAPLRAGETVRAFASTYVSECNEIIVNGQPAFAESIELWYQVRTADGYAGWVKASALRFAEEGEAWNGDR